MVLTNRWLNIDIKTLEADIRTCLFLHLAHEAYQEHKHVFIWTIDSEIVILELLETLAELWIEFGSGKSYRDILVHIPHQKLGLSKSLALPLFHSLTGCDTAHLPHLELWQEEWLECMEKYFWQRHGLSLLTIRNIWLWKVCKIALNDLLCWGTAFIC